jgi:hypothetical protein
MAIRSVRLRQSGGFAGLIRSSELAAADLTPGEKRALEDHLQGTESGADTRNPKARDLVTFELEVETDTGKTSLTFDEDTVPAVITRLVQRLSKKGRPGLP